MRGKRRDVAEGGATADEARLLSVAARCAIDDFPDFEHLEQRHRLSSGLCAALAEAARVAMDRHHPQGEALVLVDCDGNVPGQYAARWRVPSQLEKDSHGNRDDATCNGAYCLALAAVETELDMVGVGRTGVGSFADFWLHENPDAHDFEQARRMRLEVSGTDAGNEREMASRLSKKIRQARNGAENGPALAAVVGFKLSTIVLRRT